VVAVSGGDKFDVVIVHDQSRPKYPNDVACEFMGKSRDLLHDIAEGDWVAIEGSIRSKEYKGKWYTNFVCYALARLPMAGQRAPEKRPAPPPPPPLADDDLPF
jgi:hypothetical protein